MTFQSGSQPSVDYTSLATKLVLLWNHFSPGAWTGTCMAAEKGSLRHIMAGLWHRMWRECLQFIWQFGNLGRGKFNKNTSKVMGERAVFSLITRPVLPPRCYSYRTWWLSALRRGVNVSPIGFFPTVTVFLSFFLCWWERCRAMQTSPAIQANNHASPSAALDATIIIITGVQ